MARKPEEIIKQQLGSLLMEIALLTAKVEGLEEQLAQRSPSSNDVADGT